MYLEPLESEGLFPLPAPQEDKTERDLPYDFKPNVDYFAKFDAILPPWQVIPFREMPGSHAALSDIDKGDGTGPPEIKVAPRTTRVVSFRRYVRAIAPDGSLRQLVISSVRPTPAYRDGHDKAGSKQRVISDKSAKGWIVVENDVSVWNPYSGKTGQQYAAWAWAVMEYRQKRHAAYEAEYAENHKNQQTRAMEEQAKAMKGMGIEIGQAVAKAVLDNQRPRRDKVE